LGSPRVTTDSSGNVLSRRDFRPYGEEIYRPNQGTDKVRQKFTSYERDDETELDYAKARMFASGLGRFTSPDPMLTSGFVESPQTWNRYSYVSNNPLKYVDPLGLFKWSNSLGGNRSDDDIGNELNDLENEQEKQGVDNSQRIGELVNILSGRQTFRSALADLRSAYTDVSLTQNQRDEILRSLNSYGTEGDNNGVSVGRGGLREGIGAQAQLTGYQYGENGQVTGARIEVTLGSQIRGQELVMAIGHEGSHVADNQAAVAIWATTGDYARARERSATIYETENRAYHVSASLAQHQNRNNLRMGNGYTIWTRGMTTVDQTVLNALLADHYGVSPLVQGARRLP
jgi:RHS repeat-associated protein